MNIYEKLSAIQTELKAPKNNFNSFGGYKYRSAEDILEAAKPVCAKYKALLILSDEVREVGGKCYVRAAASLIDTEVSSETPDSSITVTAWAREDESKKGLTAPQLTGCSSSYSRKYALGGLLDLDDTKDADTEEYAGMSKKERDIQEQLDCANPKGTVLDNKFRCAECGKVIEPYEYKGKTIGCREHEARCLAKFGKTLCLDCIEKEKNG